MSGAQGSTACPSHEPPAGPLELHLALKNMRVRRTHIIACSEARCAKHYLAPPSAFLCRDSSVPSAAIGCSRARFPAGLASQRGAPFLASSRSAKLRMQTLHLKFVLRHDTEGDPAAIAVGRECLSQPDDSDRTEKFHRRRAQRAGLCYTRPAFEDGIFQSEMRRKGAAGGWEGDTQCSPQPPTCLFISSCYYKVKNRL